VESIARAATDAVHGGAVRAVQPVAHLRWCIAPQTGEPSDIAPVFVRVTSMDVFVEFGIVGGQSELTL